MAFLYFSWNFYLFLIKAAIYNRKRDKSQNADRDAVCILHYFAFSVIYQSTAIRNMSITIASKNHHENAVNTSDAAISRQ